MTDKKPRLSPEEFRAQQLEREKQASMAQRTAAEVEAARRQKQIDDDIRAKCDAAKSSWYDVVTDAGARNGIRFAVILRVSGNASQTPEFADLRDVIAKQGWKADLIALDAQRDEEGEVRDRQGQRGWLPKGLLQTGGGGEVRYLVVRW